MTGCAGEIIMDKRIREAIFPARIFEFRGDISNAAVLSAPTDLQIGLSETHLTCVKGKSYVVLDFGRELHGSVRILAQAAEGGGCNVRIRTGESVSEAYAERGDRNADNHHALRDVTVFLPMYSDMEFLQTGFRFVRIDFLEDKTVFIKAILATSIRRDLRPSGSFRCNDELVNRIFDVASHTLTLNMQTYIWDGIKRDRLVWIGDMHPETMGIACLFGADESVERSLSYVKEHTPLPAWMNNTPTYTAWWFVILHDYYMQNANLAYLLEQKEYLTGALRLLDSVVEDNGKICTDGSFLFDWPSHNSEDEKIGIHALWTLAAQKSEALFREVGLDPSACTQLRSKLARWRVTGSKTWKQCEAFLVYAGLKRAEEAYGFLTENGAKGFSTFLSYYILSAISDCDAKCAVELMKEYYGGMLKMGATSFWEDFDLTWTENSCPIDRLPRPGEHDVHGDFGKHCYVGFRHSLCHGWSCGPISFLIRKIGGIEILEAGCRRVKIKPLSAGFEWYEIKYPTPFGLIEIAMKEGKVQVSVPEGIILER